MCTSALIVVQVVIALVITPEGFPLGDQVLADTAEKTTRAALEDSIDEYGKRDPDHGSGIATEEAVLAEMRPPIRPFTIW